MKKIKPQIIINIIASFFILSVILYLTIKYAPVVTKLVKEPDKFRSLILSYGYFSISIFMFFQFVQVVIAAIPGEAVQMAGGYIFGGVLGTIYSTLGILAGSITAFYMARIVGLPLVRYFVPKEKFTKLSDSINSHKSDLTVFILFLIPGIPKDILVYAAGITPINPTKFFILILVARLPGIIGSSIIGANIYNKNYVIAVTVSVVALIFFIIGVFFKEKILNIFHITLKD